MEIFTVLEGIAAPIDQTVDTDQLLPSRFLRRPRKDGYQNFLLHDLRFHADGSEKPDFVLNKKPFRKACILVGERNFGTGSSREHAPWGLTDYGIRCVIAADFGDIFFQNALKIGLLPVKLDIEQCTTLREQLHANPGASMRVDLPLQLVTSPDGTTYHFELDAFRKRCLLEGLDDIGITLQQDAEITAFEQAYRKKYDWLFDIPSDTSQINSTQEG
ncbi:3-isopropylmalate dehydratase small subunit [Pollutimonas nitritireducens]|uniref:3-isopropylmalate dehydratase small subunit n=1 Tax=Pollutimonas nitritireducens TaxID=2045209 RepID=A0A2N4ULK7_9BURK|nr:3-isopropylmalate dehydratase small subunit [Pollutimonas nitritireducens]PLC55903.1 3-isopropylmalate dehydratase small subunit [Pollutimonas nitritireducens]